MSSTDKSAYSRAGVDIDAADRAKELIKQHTRSTFGPEVLTDIGLFGGMYEFKGYTKPVLVSSADGVGTKLKIASLLDKHDTVGIDLVNHCINDILCCGATPLFFLDYIAMGKLVPQKVEQLIKGMSAACRDSGCALIGGETAEMPGMYHGDDYDLAGFIIGVVEKDAVLTGNTIVAGDVIMALPSSGLHTNGYSLARSIFRIADKAAPLDVIYPELGHSLGEELLQPHRCYLNDIKPVLKRIKGLAHITGGGITGNLPRILPQGLGAKINRDAWQVPPVFKLMQKKGSVTDEEMYRVFNMGAGMLVVCSPKLLSEVAAALPQGVIIGKVLPTQEEHRIIIS